MLVDLVGILGAVQGSAHIGVQGAEKEFGYHADLLKTVR
jgi:hypothetical protein